MVIFGVLVAVMCFIGCGGGSSRLAGKWYLADASTRSASETMEILRDGTAIIDGMGMAWKTEKNRIFFTSSLGAMAFNYRISGTMLILEGNDDEYFIYVNNREETMQGKLEVRWSNGQLRMSGNFNKDGKEHGRFQEFSEDGQIILRANFVNGERHGKIEEFYQNGQIRGIGNFVNGKRHGEFVFNHDNGQLGASKNCENDECVEERFFHHDGREADQRGFFGNFGWYGRRFVGWW